MYVKRERLTRVESQQLTCRRLVEAAEKIFVRQGFEASSVEQITRAAGFTRGAFYSNFADKDELLLAVLSKRRQEMTSELEALLDSGASREERYQAARRWYTAQWRHREWIVLRTEIQLRALRSRAVRQRLARHLAEELDGYTALVARYLPEAGSTAGAAALSLLAISLGLGSLALNDGGHSVDAAFEQAQTLVFDRLLATPSTVCSSPKESPCTD
jgi:AcrR family transcriptional regulator